MLPLAATYLPAFQELDEMVVNIPERAAAWDAHRDRIANTAFPLREAPEWHDGCLKRVDVE